MALARALGVALSGVAGQLVEVEADVAPGVPGLFMTGLPDSSVLESRDRMRAALVNSGINWPNHRLTLALLPADLRKVGSRFDLAMTMALLAAAGEVPSEAVDGTVWLAELGLDGRLRPVRGVLPSLIAAVRHGVGRAVVAADNAAEASLVPGADVRAAGDLRQLVAWLRGAGTPPPAAQPAMSGGIDGEPRGADLADVAGQDGAKRALEIAAAGHHHLYLVGPPGAGKTMLAERLPGLLPPLDDSAALEVTAVHSVAGRLADGAQLVRRAPLEAPHHTATIASLVGGGSHLARPGAISLAHHGVLFLDEAPEFGPKTLDALRQPLESGQVVLHRGGGAVRYPARFLLVLAANPCPCGSRARECVCAPQARRRYRQRLSGPLLDRIDLRVDVEPVPHGDLFGQVTDRESSADVAGRVAAAREAARERWRGTPWLVNGAAPGSVLRSAPWRLPRRVLAPAEAYVQRGELSARGFDRVLRLAWTVADLSGRDVPESADVAEALFFRTGRSESWAA